MGILKIIKSKKAIKNISSIISQTSHMLPEQNIRDAKELLEYGEWGLAIDLICTQLYEYDVVITEDLYMQIIETFKLTEIDIQEWKCLKELLKADI